MTSRNFEKFLLINVKLRVIATLSQKISRLNQGFPAGVISNGDFLPVNFNGFDGACCQNKIIIQLSISNDIVDNKSGKFCGE